MDPVDGVLASLDKKMAKCEEHLLAGLAGLRTGRASAALVQNISVQYYGSPTPLHQLASITIPEPRLIVINAYDPSSLRDIEKAIVGANIGITPLNDGRVIRLPIPELSEERRTEIVKVAKRLAEESRVAVRNVRREANDELKRLEKDSKVSEDREKTGEKETQKRTDKHILKIDETLAAKTKEVMQV
jgi:ribosome recycling factor